MNRLSTIKIALNNISRRRFRSLCVAALVAFATVMITGGTWLGAGLRNGVGSITARLGAEAMIVPRSASDSVESALLSGAPSTFYLDANIYTQISAMREVQRATAQLFISTFDSSHCAALVQIIGYDPATDFVVSPWLKSSRIAKPGDGEVIVGAGLTALKVGDNFQVFALNLKVVGTLDKTGMGFDNSVFVNLRTAQTLLGEYVKFRGASPLPEGAAADSIVSAILLDLKSAADLTAFQRTINLNFRDADIRVVLQRDLLLNTSKNLGLVTGVLTVLLIGIWTFAAFAAAIIFTITLNERSREFGILRVIGANKRKLAAIVMSESAFLCGIGALSGVVIVSLVVFPYGILIERALKTTAFLPPQNFAAAAILLICFLLGAVIGPLSSLFSVLRLVKTETFDNLREGL